MILLLVIFVASLVIGYRVISNIPSLLHTPLMSGMNALDGVIILGALTATNLATTTAGTLLGAFGVGMAIVNVFGGFDITHKMLRMIAGKKR